MIPLQLFTLPDRVNLSGRAIPLITPPQTVLFSRVSSYINISRRQTNLFAERITINPYHVSPKRTPVVIIRSNKVSKRGAGRKFANVSIS